MTTSAADERSWASHIDEFRAVRGATLTLFQNLPDDAWPRRGIASGNTVSVRALAYISAGHVTHHLRILRSAICSTMKNGAVRAPASSCASRRTTARRHDGTQTVVEMPRSYAGEPNQFDGREPEMVALSPNVHPR